MDSSAYDLFNRMFSGGYSGGAPISNTANRFASAPSIGLTPNLGCFNSINCATSGSPVTASPPVTTARYMPFLSASQSMPAMAAVTQPGLTRAIGPAPPVPASAARVLASESAAVPVASSSSPDSTAVAVTVGGCPHGQDCPHHGRRMRRFARGSGVLGTLEFLFDDVVHNIKDYAIIVLLIALLWKETRPQSV